MTISQVRFIMDENELKRLGNEHGLQWNKWRDFLVRWADALATYGTPANFVDGTRYEQTDLNLNDSAYKISLKQGNFELRRELMKKQKPYLPRMEDSEDYDLRLNIDDCFLCQNVVQGLDAQLNPSIDSIDSIDNVMADYMDYFIMPNRYPAVAGHSLWVPTNHDEISLRVKPDKYGALPPEEGKTRGAILTSQELEDLGDATSDYHLYGIRNHVLDGMSIPGHDHFHLMPEDNPLFAQVSYLMQDQSDDYGKGIFRLKNTPFDTLAITSDVQDKFSEIASHVLENMEKDNQSFTLLYRDGLMLISPRKNINDHKRIQIGGAIHYHSFDNVAQDFLDKLLNYVPKRGEYYWTKYLM
jgi:hypothetical protein